MRSKIRQTLSYGLSFAPKRTRLKARDVLYEVCRKDQDFESGRKSQKMPCYSLNEAWEKSMKSKIGQTFSYGMSFAPKRTRLKARDVLYEVCRKDQDFESGRKSQKKVLCRFITLWKSGKK